MEFCSSYQIAETKEDEMVKHIAVMRSVKISGKKFNRKKYVRNSSLGRPRRRREDNIKIDLTTGFKSIDWIHLTELESSGLFLYTC
jgi:hypothetical protein